jgi:hypothetical protein
MRFAGFPSAAWISPIIRSVRSPAQIRAPRFQESPASDWPCSARLQLLGGEPVGRELMECGVDRLGRRRIRSRTPPDAEVDVAQHDGELAFRHLGRPPILGAAELDHPALSVGSEAQRKAAPAPAGLDHLSGRVGSHQPSARTVMGPVCRFPVLTKRLEFGVDAATALCGTFSAPDSGAAAFGEAVGVAPGGCSARDQGARVVTLGVAMVSPPYSQVLN